MFAADITHAQKHEWYIHMYNVLYLQGCKMSSTFQVTGTWILHLKEIWKKTANVYGLPRYFVLYLLCNF